MLFGPFFLQQFMLLYLLAPFTQFSANSNFIFWLNKAVIPILFYLNLISVIYKKWKNSKKCKKSNKYNALSNCK